jgi:hypothetical protein
MTDLVRGTSEWWLDRLGKKLATRAIDLRKLDDYYQGVQGRRFIGTKYRELFAKLFEHYRENLCGVVVDAVDERLEVQGFRFPRSGEDGTRPRTFARDRSDADTDAWRIWQDNGLDASSSIAHVECLVKSVVYVLVSPFRNEFVADRSPQITVEDALETIVEFRAGSTERVVGMKRWLDDETGDTFASLYFPDRIEKWRADRRHTADSIAARTALGERINWIRREVPGEQWPLPHSLGVVPLVPLVNRPRLAGVGRSEIDEIIPIQDAINTIAINGLVASEAAAFPQKWATGIEIPKDEKGHDLAPWQPDIERILSTAVPDAKFGQFTPADLAQWGTEIDRKVKRAASISRTPYHYFLDHGGQPPSAESIKSSETGLVRKAGRHQRFKGEGWEEVLRLAFGAMDDARSQILDAEVIWANPETLSESEHVDALVKRRSLRVPLRQLWEDDGYSPQQIARFEELLREERDIWTPPGMAWPSGLAGSEVPSTTQGPIDGQGGTSSP